jgi:ATP-binding cassette subfamily C protein CydC
MRTLATLLRLLAPFRWRIILAVLLGVIVVACNAGLLGMAAYLISDAALRPLLVTLALPIYVVRFAGVARAGARYAERLVGHDVTFRLLARLRTQVYRRLVRLAPGQVLAYRSGDLLTRLVADVDELQHVYLRVVGPFLVAGVLAVLTAGLFALFSPVLAWTALAFLAVAGIGIPLLAERLGRPVGAHQAGARAALRVHLVDGIQGAQDLLAFGHERAYQASLEEHDGVLARLQRRMALISGLERALNDALLSLGMWTILVLAIPLVARQHIGGVYLAFLALVFLASFEAVQPLAPALQALGRTLAAGQRVLAIIESTPAVVDADSTLTALADRPVPAPEAPGGERLLALAFDRVSFAYGREDEAVLRGISFTVPPGGRLAIVGPSGAGKTTVMQLALRFYDPAAGTIRLDGKTLSQYALRDLRATLGLVSREAYIFNATLRANLLLARSAATDDELIAALEQARLRDCLDSLPNGLDSWLGEHGERLSAGERQRLAIARVLLLDAPVLLLDEPTANLDTLTEGEVLDALEVAMRGRTTVMATHRLCRMERMHEILVLDGGQIVERGTHHQLLAEQGLYRRLFDVQSGILALEPALAEEALYG